MVFFINCVDRLSAFCLKLIFSPIFYWCEGELNAIQGPNHCVQLLSVEVTLPYLHQEIISIVEKLSKLGNYNYRILQEGNYNFNQNYIEKSQLIKMIKEENINGVFELYCYLNISSDN